jgi:hypothetical protein
MLKLNKMKIIVNLTVVFMLICSVVYSQNIFNQSNIQIINVYNPNYQNTIGNIKLDLSPINSSNNRLDLVSISNLNYMIDFNHGDWNLNNGNGTFGSYNNFYSNFQTTETLNDVKFVKIRDNASQKDVVVLKKKIINNIDNYELNIHQNTNNSIGGVYQSNTGTGNYTNMDAGRFNYEDTREDVVITSGNVVKIYKNLGNGNLDPNNWTFSFPGTKVMLKQMTDKNILDFQNSSSDRDELITSNGNILRIYKNNNSNGFEANPQVYDAGFEIKDFEITDLNNDGYNDIVIVGNGVAKGFTNVKGQSVDFSSPTWNISSGNWYNAKVSFADLNKDGLNDIVIVGMDCCVNVFLSPNISQLSQSFYAGAPYDNTVDIKLGDIYNTGGIALLISYSGGRIISGGEEYWYGIKTVNATNPQTIPAPSSIKGETQVDGQFLRPRIRLNDMGERDFNHYQIWKKKTGWSDFQVINSNLSGQNYFVDYSEYIIYTDDGPIYTDENCWYKVKSVDSYNNVSLYSNQVGYTVGIASCANCVSDNSSGNENELKIDKYSITNFPNPFNPSTKILYSVPKTGNVKITIYNSLGKEIKSLVNEFKSVGSHIIEFNGSDLSSGVYYYKIEAGSFVQTNRMLLIK